MSTVLIVAEAQPDGHLRKATLHAIAAGKDLAQKTGAQLHLAVVAENPSALAEQLKPYGAAVVHTIASPAFLTTWPSRSLRRSPRSRVPPARASWVPPPPRRDVISCPGWPLA